MTAVLDRVAHDLDQRRWSERFHEMRPTPASPPQHASRRGFGHPSAVVMLLPVRIFLAAGWIRAGAEKLLDRQWWDGTLLRSFLQEQHQEALPFFRPVMDHAIAPAAIVVAITVMATQILCGVCIGTGLKMRLALRWGFVMNVTFILAGRVDPSAFYIVMEVVLLFAIADGTLGVNPSTPSRRTFLAAGASAALAVVFIPYIRTIEPAEVIHDPAMMLAFIGMVIAATLVVRRAAAQESLTTRLDRLWAYRLAGWTHAKPRAVMQSATDAPMASVGACSPSSKGAFSGASWRRNARPLISIR